MHLSIDFYAILVDFGSQVGKQNRAKIDQKWHRKNEEKKKGNKMAKKSQFEIPTPREGAVPDPRGGIPLIAGQTPPPPGANRVFPTSLSLCLPSLSLSLLCPGLSLPVLSCPGSVFPPNLASKICQNSRKIDVKRQSILDFKF